MVSLLHDPALALAMALALAALFGVAARHKLRDPGVFRATLAQYRLLPEALVSPAAVLVVAAELAVAGALLWPGTRAIGALGALALLAGYGVAIGVNLARGRRNVDCGCLGPGQRQPLSEWLLVRNAVVALAAVPLLATPAGPRTLGWIDVATIGGTLAVLGLAWTAANGLMTTWPRLSAARRHA